METLKQSAIAAISQLPDTANINEMQAVFKQLERQAMQRPNEITVEETENISCYDLAKDLLGSGEGPEDLSTNKAYLRRLRLLKRQPVILDTGPISGFYQS